MRPERTVSVRSKFEFTRKPSGTTLRAMGEDPKAHPKPAITLTPVIDPRLAPKLTRLLVLGYRLEQLARESVVQDYTQLAKVFGLSKGRVTQLVNLTMLAPDIQHELLHLNASDIRGRRLCERNLRKLTALADWREQRAALNLSFR